MASSKDYLNYILDQLSGLDDIFIVILAAFVIGGIWAFVVTKKTKKEGIETDALVSRVL